MPFRENDLIRHTISLGLLFALACTGTKEYSPRELKENPSDPETKLEFRDDNGSVIKLQGTAKRIASLAPSYTEILFALGCGESIVVRDIFSDYPSKALEIPSTDGINLSIEHILSFNPDLILAFKSNPARLDAARRTGIPVAVFKPGNMKEIFKTIRTLSSLCGRISGAAGVIEYMKKRISAVKKAVMGRKRPLVFVEVDGSDPNRPWTAGPGSFLDQIISMAGGRNLAHDIEEEWGVITAEEVVRRNPDFIVLLMGTESTARADTDRFRQRPGWSRINAVKNGNVISDIPQAKLSRPGPEIMDGLEALARKLHPEAFLRK